jgi:hypothetical protein
MAESMLLIHFRIESLGAAPVEKRLRVPPSTTLGELKAFIATNYSVPDPVLVARMKRSYPNERSKLFQRDDVLVSAVAAISFDAYWEISVRPRTEMLHFSFRIECEDERYRGEHTILLDPSTSVEGLKYNLEIEFNVHDPVIVLFGGDADADADTALNDAGPECLLSAEPLGGLFTREHTFMVYPRQYMRWLAAHEKKKARSDAESVWLEFGLEGSPFTVNLCVERTMTYVHVLEELAVTLWLEESNSHEIRWGPTRTANVLSNDALATEVSAETARLGTPTVYKKSAY